MTIGGNPFQVIGILTSSGSTGFTNNDDLAVIPITTAQDEVTGGSPNSVQRILLTASSSNTLGSAYDEADQLLLQTHHITNTAAADFSITSASTLASTAASVTTTLTILLASVAAISLLVGGIGVMNIMLVSVTERTQEIGLRKALGATPSDLLRQFLIEAATLSFVGGVLGVGAALLAGFLVPATREHRGDDHRDAGDHRRRRCGRSWPDLRRLSRGARRPSRTDRGPSSRMTPTAFILLGGTTS